MIENNGRGFAGLTTLVSDISSDIADAERFARFPQPTPRTVAAPPPAPQVIRAPFGKMSVGAKWALGLGVAVAGIWLFAFLGDLPSAPPATPARVEAPSVPPPRVTIPSAPAATPPSLNTRDLYGTKPPVGRGLVLDSSQIRYCVAENIRLETISALVDKRSGQEVDRFNARVQDFNSRCSEFKYRRGTLEGIRQELEAQRGSIEAHARLQWGAAR